MTMTPDELRALADALHWVQYTADWQTCDRAADYLRAQADAQPVAWMYEHDGCVDTPVFAVNRWTKCEEPWNESPLFLHPAPAAPQAEPIDPHMIVAEDRFPDEQAEPKRGLTCLWSRADDDTDMWETSCGHAFTIIDGTPSDNHMGFCCYCGRRVDEEIGGSDAE